MTHLPRETLALSDHPLRPGGLGEVVRLALPAVAGSASYVAMGFVNTIMVVGVGPGAVGAVTSSVLIFNVLLMACAGLLSAIVPFTSQSHSRGRHLDGARYTWQGVYVALLLGLAGPALLALLPAFYQLVGHGAAVQEMEVSYTGYRLLSLPLILVATALSNFLQGLGRTRSIMVVTILSNLVNVILNYLLIGGHGGFPALGVAGAGLSALVAGLVAMLGFMAYYFSARLHREHQTRRPARPSLPYAKGLLRVGLPTSLQWSMDLLVWAIWHAWLIGKLGPDALDANGAVNEITSLAWMPVLGLNQAAASLSGWYLGRQRPDLVRRAIRNCLAVASVYMGLMALLFFIWGREFVQLFFLNADRPAVLLMGASALHIAATFQIFDGLNITLAGALRGGGDTLFPALAQQLIAWPIFLPLTYVMCLNFGLGLDGAWYSTAIYLALLSVVLGWRYRGDAWMRKNIFRDRPDLPA